MNTEEETKELPYIYIVSNSCRIDGKRMSLLIRFYDLQDAKNFYDDIDPFSPECDLFLSAEAPCNVQLIRENPEAYKEGSAKSCITVLLSKSLFMDHGQILQGLQDNFDGFVAQIGRDFTKRMGEAITEIENILKQTK